MEKSKRELMDNVLRCRPLVTDQFNRPFLTAFATLGFLPERVFSGRFGERSSLRSVPIS